jgi:hypothetical protein
MLPATEDAPQVGREPRESDESRTSSHQLGSKLIGPFVQQPPWIGAVSPSLPPSTARRRAWLAPRRADSCPRRLRRRRAAGPAWPRARPPSPRRARPARPRGRRNGARDARRHRPSIPPPGRMKQDAASLAGPRRRCPGAGGRFSPVHGRWRGSNGREQLAADRCTPATLPHRPGSPGWCRPLCPVQPGEGLEPLPRSKNDGAAPVVDRSRAHTRLDPSESHTRRLGPQPVAKSTIPTGEQRARRFVSVHPRRRNVRKAVTSRPRARTQSVRWPSHCPRAPEDRRGRASIPGCTNRGRT